MNKIESLLSTYGVSDKRSALYYVGRYIKQAETFEDYKKDIFDDTPESAPSEAVKSLSLELISLIEAEAGKKASDFNEDEFYHWMDFISELEDNIDPEFSKAEMERAETALAQFKVPGQ